MKAMARRTKDPTRLPFLLLVGLGVLPLAALVGAVKPVVRSPLPIPLLDTCLRLLGVGLGVVRSPFPWHPLTTLAAILVSASFLFALARAVTSFVRSWRLYTRLKPYRAGRCGKLDQVLDHAPALKTLNLRVLETLRPLAFTIGFSRPAVCLSTGLVDLLSEGELRAVLFHERSHAARRDPFRLWIAGFVADALWFLPVARSLKAAFLDIIEQAADDQAVGAQVPPLELAEAIVKTAQGGLTPPLKPATLLQGRLSLEERVLRLLDGEGGARFRIPRRSLYRSGIALLVLISALLGPSLVAPPDQTQAFRLSEEGIACDLPVGS